MKSLKESILSNTNIGISSTIEKWFKSVRNDIPFRVESINSKWFVILDDFASQPRQHTIELDSNTFKSMPKQLCGIYKIYYDNKYAKGELKPMLIKFQFIKNATIDLSHWDMSLGYINVLDNQITFEHILNTNIIGLPKYTSPAYIVFYDCENGKISVKGNYNFTTDTYGYLDITKMKNCDIIQLYMNKRTISNNKTNNNIYAFEKFNSFPVILHEYAQILDDLTKNNKIQKLNYFGDNLDPSDIAHTTSKLEKTKDGDWIIKPMK